VADAVGAAWDVETLSTDRIRQEWLGPSRQPAEYGEGLYQPAQRQRVYERLLEAADDRLARGLSVVLDGAFLRRELRAQVYDVAAARGAKSLYVRCECPREVARARIERRRSLPGQASEARSELAELQLQEWEDAAPEEPLLAVDATRPVHELLDQVAAAARAVLFDSAY
jgi:predicted kinase